MAYSKMTDSDWKYPPSEPREEGGLLLCEQPRHVMHWAEYGNPQGEPVIVLHGGPGGACEGNYARFFDPERYRIILFDQRGCGESIPHVTEDLAGAMAENSTPQLVADIEALRAARGITGKAHIFGGSWGSTLAMAYAQAHPEHVQDLILRGIFLCNRNDLGFFYQGNAATYADSPDNLTQPGAYRAYYPKADFVQAGVADAFTVPEAQQTPEMAAAFADAWHQYVSLIPPAERGDMIAAYHRRLNDPALTPAEKLPFAQAWSIWEGVTSYLNHDVSDLGRFAEPDFAVAFATIENTYFYRALRGEDAAIRGLMQPENLAKLATIPTYIVQGAHDQVCVPSSAHALRDALVEAGATLQYQETTAGHSMKERATHAALTAVMDTLPRMRTPWTARNSASRADAIEPSGRA